MLELEHISVRFAAGHGKIREPSPAFFEESCFKNFLRLINKVKERLLRMR